MPVGDSASPQASLKSYPTPHVLWLGGGLALLAIAAIAVHFFAPGRSGQFTDGPLTAHRTPQQAEQIEPAEEGDIAYLGARLSNLTPEQASQIGFAEPRGVLLDLVVAGGPAEKAGLAKDDVVVKAGSEAVVDTEQFLKMIDGSPPDGMLDLTIVRAGEKRLVSVKLGAFLRDTIPLANTGDIRAMHWLIGIFFSERLGKPDPAEGMRWLRKAAEAGDLAAIHSLAHRLWRGTDTAPDRAEALRLWDGAARNGHVPAMIQLGNLHYRGETGEKNYPEAMRYYRLAADSGNGSAMRMIGYMFEQGIGVDRSTAEGIAWYRKGAEAGDATAMYNLGVVYDMGRGVPEDHAQAAAWYRKAMEKGSSYPLFNMGLLYHNGQGVGRDFATAAEYAYRALLAADGHAISRLSDPSKNWHLDFIRRLQELLRQDGSYTGTLDGRVGPQLQQAIKAAAQKVQSKSTQTTSTAAPRTQPDLGLDDLENLKSLD